MPSTYLSKEHRLLSHLGGKNQLGETTYARHSYPNGFFWGHKYLCTLTSANSMQVLNM